MVHNEELGAVVLKEMSRHFIGIDPAFKMMCDENVEIGAELLRGRAEAMVDTPHKVRLHIARFIGYGYDFTQTDGNRELYERAVVNTRDHQLGDLGETLLADGIVDDRFGWYITDLG